MPPEIIQLLSLPFFGALGVIAKIIWDAVRDRNVHKVALSQVNVSEKDANTRQFEAIVEGFTQSLTAARTEAERANTRAGALETRLDNLERERAVEHIQIVEHLTKLEMLVPNPPGPPPRPTWLVY